MIFLVLSGCLLAGSALGRKGIQAERVGSDAAEMLLKNLSYEACVDEYLQDQVSFILLHLVLTHLNMEYLNLIFVSRQLSFPIMNYQKNHVPQLTPVIVNYILWPFRTYSM